jgi:hypothetical protein
LEQHWGFSGHARQSNWLARYRIVFSFVMPVRAMLNGGRSEERAYTVADRQIERAAGTAVLTLCYAPLASL